MVLGSQPSSVEIYSVPLWPSLATSMAAYRLRSFSESESWNIRIECSISGLYVMAGRPLRGRDRPAYGYTMRKANREVIESAVLSDPRVDLRVLRVHDELRDHAPWHSVLEGQLGGVRVGGPDG